MSTKELQAQLEQLVSKFEAALSEAVDFATEHKLSFNLEPTYGAGCTFNGESVGEENY